MQQAAKISQRHKRSIGIANFRKSHFRPGPACIMCFVMMVGLAAVDLCNGCAEKSLGRKFDELEDQ